MATVTQDDVDSTLGAGGGLARDSHKPFLDYMRLSMCVLCVCVRMCCVCSLYESLIDF